MNRIKLYEEYTNENGYYHKRGYEDNDLYIKAPLRMSNSTLEKIRKFVPNQTYLNYLAYKYDANSRVLIYNDKSKDVSLHIYETDDEYFLVYLNKNYDSPPSDEIYKCDQLSGLEKLFKDLHENKII